MPKRKRYKSYSWTHPKTKKLYARVQIKQPDGSIKTYLKPALNKTHVEQLANEMLADYAVRKSGFLEGEVLTFSSFADWYMEHHSIPPQYSEDGTKIAGIRTYQTEKRRIEKMKTYFGEILLKNINEDVLHRYKLKREKELVSPATINRDLEILRAMFGKAVRRRWLKENPFDFGEKLIEKSRERKREIVLTESQENSILAAAKQSEKSHIYYALLCLMDTGARPSEIYDASTEKAEPVKWKDFFDYDFKAVKLTSYKGKQIKIRFVPVSFRLKNAMLEFWKSLSVQDLNSQIFEIKSFKTAWKTVLKKAELENIRIRDLRRSFSTRLANLGIENDVRQRILGHEQAQTTFDYTAANLETALKIGERMNNLEVQEFEGEN